MLRVIVFRTRSPGHEVVHPAVASLLDVLKNAVFREFFKKNDNNFSTFKWVCLLPANAEVRHEQINSVGKFAQKNGLTVNKWTNVQYIYLPSEADTNKNTHHQLSWRDFLT